MHDPFFYRNSVSFAKPSAAAPLRSNRELVRYIHQVTATHIESLRNQPVYKQLSHSRRVLKNLTDVTRILYECCIKQLPSLWKNFDVQVAALCVDCFYQSLTTAKEVFSKKFDEFIKGVGKINRMRLKKHFRIVYHRFPSNAHIHLQGCNHFDSRHHRPVHT